MNLIRKLLASCILAAAASAPAIASCRRIRDGAVSRRRSPDAIARSLNPLVQGAWPAGAGGEPRRCPSGAIAAQKVLSAPADGYAVFLGSPNEVILSPLSNAAVKLHTEDFELLRPVTINRLVMVARPDTRGPHGR
ncbi:hypothetical protein ACU4GD_38010 [Cupriavidus basilensis]